MLYQLSYSRVGQRVARRRVAGKRGARPALGDCGTG
jgi:hypothetical protein